MEISITITEDLLRKKLSEKQKEELLFNLLKVSCTETIQKTITRFTESYGSSYDFFLRDLE